MPQIRLDLTRVQDLDLSTGRVVQIPVRQPPRFGEQTALRAALTASAAAGGRNAGLLKNFLALGSAPSLGVSVVGSIRSALAPPSTSDLTVALGPFVSVSALGGHGEAHDGVYFWRNPKEFGFYGGAGIGAAAQLVSFGVGGQLTFLLGPAPSVLKGFSLVVGVDIGIPGKEVFGGGYLVFSVSPFRFVGMGLDVGWGMGAIPVEFSATLSGTAIKKVGRI